MCQISQKIQAHGNPNEFNLTDSSVDYRWVFRWMKVALMVTAGVPCMPLTLHKS